MTRSFPFLHTPKAKIVPIGNEQDGICYMLQKGAITPRENPIDIQEQEKQQAKVQVKLMKAVKRLAESENISRQEARKRLFATPVKKADETEIEKEELEQESALSMYDHLDETEAIDLMALLGQSKIEVLKYSAVTTFINYRLAYPVELSDDAGPQVQSLKINNLGFPIEAGDRIKYGDLLITVSDYAEPGCSQLTIKPSPAPLKAKQVGFLCLPDSRKEKLGDPEWTVEETRSLLTEAQINAIFTFFQTESGGIIAIQEETEKEEAKRDEGESLPALNGSSSESQLTGEKSGLDLASSDVESLNSNHGSPSLVSQFH